MMHLFSYPYEWCFGELKEAASTTLEIQRIALELGMMLKDASATTFNLTRSGPAQIDRLSFEAYRGGGAWASCGTVPLANRPKDRARRGPRAFRVWRENREAALP